MSKFENGVNVKGIGISAHPFEPSVINDGRRLNNHNGKNTYQTLTKYHHDTHQLNKQLTRSKTRTISFDRALTK